MYIHLLSPVILKSGKPGFVCCCEYHEDDYKPWCDMLYAVPVDKNRKMFPEYTCSTVIYHGQGSWSEGENFLIRSEDNTRLILATVYGDFIFEPLRVDRYKYLKYAGKFKHDDFKFELLPLTLCKGETEVLYEKEHRIIIGAPETYPK